jgi:hypothetical protein
MSRDFGGAEQAAEKPWNAVILSAAKDLGLRVFNAMRDSSSLLLLRMTVLALNVAPPLRAAHAGLNRLRKNSMEPVAGRWESLGCSLCG